MIDVETELSLLTGEPVLAINEIASFAPSKVIQSQIFDCALSAIGITAIGELISNGISKMGKRAVRVLMRKIASKYLGWVGAAIAAYEFGDCMEWW